MYPESFDAYNWAFEAKGFLQLVAEMVTFTPEIDLALHMRLFQGCVNSHFKQHVFNIFIKQKYSEYEILL